MCILYTTLSMDNKALLSKINTLTQALISDAEFEDELMNEIQTNAKILQDKKETHVVPRLVVLHRKTFNKSFERTVCMFLDLPLDDEKHKMMMGLGARIADENINPVAILFTSEAWMKKAQTEAEHEEVLKSKKKVREYDDKEEAIIVMGCTLDKREKAAITMITHDEKGNIVTGAFKIIDGVQNELLYRFYEGFTRAMVIKGRI